MQYCPKCKKGRFIWTVDEEVSPLTVWFCGYCKYSADEDEKKETTCPACGIERCYLHMKDEDRTYWYCCHCGRMMDVDKEEFNFSFRAKMRAFIRKIFRKKQPAQKTGE